MAGMMLLFHVVVRRDRSRNSCRHPVLVGKSVMAVLGQFIGGDSSGDCFELAVLDVLSNRDGRN